MSTRDGTIPSAPNPRTGPIRSVLLLGAITALAVGVVVTTQGDATSTQLRYSVVRLAAAGLIAAAALAWRVPLGDRSIGAAARGLRFAWPVYLVGVLALLAGAADRSGAFLGWGALVLFTLSMASVGLFEETLARGLVLGRLLRDLPTGGTQRAALVSSVVFGVAHLVNLPRQGLVVTLVQVLYATLIGYFLAAVRLSSGSLAAVVMVHAVLDWTFYLGSDVFAASGTTSSAGIATGVVALVVGALLAARGARLLRPALGAVA
jgi:membrane protease YdiL (CAAX protease family)